MDNAVNYSSIESQIEKTRVDDPEPFHESDNLILKKAAYVIVGLGSVILFAASFTSNATQLSSQTPVKNSLMGFPQIRTCTLNECYQAGCDKTTAPFICEFHNGGPHGGCSATPWIEGTCENQCNLKACDSLVIPADVDSCESTKCDEEWCKMGQLCGNDVPFQCTQGSARFGCTVDKLAWTIKAADTLCSECCDVTTCSV